MYFLKKLSLPLLLAVAIYLLFPAELSAQRKWKRKEAVKPELQLFHSTQVLHLQTAETLQKGDFQFEISHRFLTPLSSGVSELYGLDGSVNMRIALGYGISNTLVATLARSNREGNIDFRMKYKALQIRHETFPLLVAVQAGLAYNGKPLLEIDESDKYQFYGQLIINTLIAGKLGIGISPSYLLNSHIYCVDKQNSFTFGMYVQQYLNEQWSLVAEANPTVTGWRNAHNSFAFGLELNTGGHFFKFVFGNSVSLNPGQYLSGAPDSFSSGDWHFGFNITRLFKI